MFYCNKCAIDNNYPQSIGKSVGRCEICNKVCACNDIPSSRLPIYVNKQQLLIDQKGNVITKSSKS